MRISAIAIVGCVAALLSGPAFAGKPDSPGAGGQVNKEVKDFADANGMTPGEVKKQFTDSIGENYGQLKKEFIAEGRPNPANDNGGGND